MKNFPHKESFKENCSNKCMFLIFLLYFNENLYEFGISDLIPNPYKF